MKECALCWHESSSLCPLLFSRRTTPTTCLTSACERTKEFQEGETKRKESPGWDWSHQSTTPAMAFQGEKTLSSRLSRSIEMYCIYADIKNKNYKEKERGKRGEWGWDFRSENYLVSPRLQLAIHPPLQYSPPPTGNYSFVSLFALLNSEIFDKRDSILGKFATPFHTVPMYIFFE